MTKLEELDIKYTSFFGQFDSYLEFFNAMFAPIQVGTCRNHCTHSKTHANFK
jgi:hypothetical protein